MRPYIDHITSKISKIVAKIARLRHHVLTNTLLQIYRSLTFPYTFYSRPVWGQASQCDLKNLDSHSAKVVSPPNCLCQQNFPCHPFFVSSSIRPVNAFYFETVSTLKHDFSTHSTPKNIREHFIHSSDVHKYNTRFSCEDNLFVQKSRLHMKLKSFPAFGTRLWNCLHPDWRKLA